MGAIRTIAWREMRDSLHSRWLIGFGLLFVLLTVGISYYGLASSRQIGFQGFELVAASLLNLVLFAVPMVAMAQATLSLASDGDNLSILLTQPLTRTQVLAGKYLGITGAVLATILGGLILGGLVIVATSGGAHAGDFALLVGLTAILILLFAAVGTLVSVVWRDRTKALGVGLSLWFGLVILYDLLVFGLAIAGPGIPLKTLLLTALIGNPVDVVRVFYLLASGNNGFVGAAGAVLGETLGSGAGLFLLGASLAAWILASLMGAKLVLQRKDF